MKKILLFLMIGMFLLSFTSSLDSQGTGTVGENFTFIQTCDSASYITLSTLQSPNRSAESINVNMTSIGGGAFQYNFTDLVSGRYDVTGISDGCTKTFSTYFNITPTGSDFDTSQGIMTLGLLLVLIFLTSVFLFFGVKIEYVPFKIFLTSLGVLFLMLTIGISVNTIKELMLVNSIFSATFVNLYRLMLILVSAGGIGLIVYLVYVSLRQFYSYRGLIDDKYDLD